MSERASTASAIDLEQLTRVFDALSDANRLRMVELLAERELSGAELSEALGISPATVKRDWVVARAWLFRELSRRADAAP